MEVVKKQTASREDWLKVALDTIRYQGVEGVKVVVMARKLGLTSGSFYWHFKNVQDLLDAVLEYWENRLTEHIIEDAIRFDGTAQQRLLKIMLQVIEEDASVPDSAIAVWAKSDAKANAAYKRSMERRFNFAASVFRQIGFSKEEAAARGRMMVTALMGETANGIKSDPNWKSIIEQQWRVLIALKI